ncbi:MAG: hypothetical protein M1832_004467 [Thelocarpon impressellum]|nr:MAG: hypothetical protein M1832_004467 [Thelocarpon impressellum]
MSERKVLTKYFPPDFDPSKIVRSRVPKAAGPKLQPVRLMAPFSMKCVSCGEYVYKGRKFNARKETTDEKYYGISIYRFYIRCTRCSAEITFKTDPKNMDYTCERGAKRNFEPWRVQGGQEESEEERLDRLEREEEEKNAMVELEIKTLDAKREMQIADALDEIRTRNARNERGDAAGIAAGPARDSIDEERARAEREDEEAARRAFARNNALDMALEVEMETEVEVGEDNEAASGSGVTPDAAPARSVSKTMDPPSFKRAPKKKKDFSAALGIKKKPGLV